MIAKLLHTAERLWRPKEAPYDPSRLTFELSDMDHGEVVREVNGFIKIARSGKGFAYVIGDGTRLSGAETRSIAEVKGRMIAQLSDSDPGKMGIEAAMGMARSMLAEDVSARKELLSYLIAHDTVRFGPFSMLLENKEGIEEVELNSLSDPICIYDADHGRCRTNIHFRDDDSFRNDINRLIASSERELGEKSPVIDVQVAGSRIHAQTWPYATGGALASIRLANRKGVGFEQMLGANALSLESLVYLWMALDSRANIVIAGAPASGKTTLLRNMLSLIPAYVKTVTIEEDVGEIGLDGYPNHIAALYGARHGSVTPKDQVINALRIRPDRIVVGEIRGEETGNMFMGANIGIPFITTMHSNDDANAIVRRLMLKPMAVDLQAIAMLDVCLYMKQSGINDRRLTDIYEYRWLSRAETESGTEIEKSDLVAITKVCENGMFNMEKLESSKIIEIFGKRNDMYAKQPHREFMKRLKFLERHVKGQKMGVAEALNMYRR
ncbi:MAG: CpaF family protein [Candidatus Micrarchaeota archaeon]|nr:CpaF family protein [Candidatus Micrarchaeota archaeon]